ncbi:MAG: protein kinase domain-containing protein, partial [Gemmataceae bacterium]
MVMDAHHLFQIAAPLSETDRAAFLVQVRAEHPELHQSVEALLAEYCSSESQLSATVQLLPVEYVPRHPLNNLSLKDHLTYLNDLSGVVFAGKYKLLEPIGEGGMGSVWWAKQSEPVQRFVAVKLIKPGKDTQEMLSRFKVEQQALALMDHPNIAKVLDGGLHENRPFLVMEWVK